MNTPEEKKVSLRQAIELPGSALPLLFDLALGEAASIAEQRTVALGLQPSSFYQSSQSCIYPYYKHISRLC